MNKGVEDRLGEITDAEQKREKRLKTNEESLRELWDNVKRTNIRIIGVPEEKRERKGQKTYSKRKKLKTSLTWERNHSLKSRKHNKHHIK